MVDEPNKTPNRVKFLLRSLGRFNRLLEKKEALTESVKATGQIARHLNSTNLSGGVKKNLRPLIQRRLGEDCGRGGMPKPESTSIAVPAQSFSRFNTETGMARVL